MFICIILTFLDPVLERFTLEVPTVIENTYSNITCSSSSGNPLPQLWWFCDSIEPDNVTVEITSSTSRAVLSFIPKRGDNGNNCTCFGQQERTTFHNLSESVRVNILCKCYVNEIYKITKYTFKVYMFTLMKE